MPAALISGSSARIASETYEVVTTSARCLIAARITSAWYVYGTSEMTTSWPSTAAPRSFASLTFTRRVSTSRPRATFSGVRCDATVTRYSGKRTRYSTTGRAT